jgi:hypothetical protein
MYAGTSWKQGHKLDPAKSCSGMPGHPDIQNILIQFPISNIVEDSSSNVWVFRSTHQSATPPNPNFDFEMMQCRLVRVRSSTVPPLHIRNVPCISVHMARAALQRVGRLCWRGLVSEFCAVSQHTCSRPWALSFHCADGICRQFAFRVSMLCSTSCLLGSEY